MSWVRITARLRDWWRGYTDADIEAARRFWMAPKQPGSVTELPVGVMRALVGEGIAR